MNLPVKKHSQDSESNVLRGAISCAQFALARSRPCRRGQWQRFSHRFCSMELLVEVVSSVVLVVLQSLARLRRTCHHYACRQMEQ